MSLDIHDDLHSRKKTIDLDFSSRPRILIVDDEVPALLSLKRSLRPDFDVDVAASAADALILIERNAPYSVVISDMRMPHEDGVSFLSKVKKYSPSSVRMMLTGDKTPATAINAVNRGEVFRFLEKPCPHYVMQSALEEALSHAQKINEKSQVLGDLPELLETFREEFQIPLHYIVDFAAYLADDKSNAKAICDYARFIQNSGRSLVEAADRLLTLEQLNRKHYKPLPKWVSPRVLITPIFEECRTFARSKNITFRLMPNGETGDLCIDQKLMTKALQVLIFHAIRLGGKNSQVSVKFNRCAAPFSALCIDVSNGGDAYIMDGATPRFASCDTPSPHALGDAATGFRLAQAICEAHGGALYVKQPQADVMLMRIELPSRCAGAGWHCESKHYQ